MSIQHARSGEVVRLPLGSALASSQTTTLVKTDDLEVLRLVLPAGKEIASHQAPSEITVQCLEGRVAFTAHGKSQELSPGDMLYLAASEPHAVQSVEDSTVLVTLLLAKK